MTKKSKKQLTTDATKVYVLDTNVILYDYMAIYNFEENVVVIPITVLEEIDRFKKGNEIINYNARQFIRELDELVNGDFLDEEITLPKGGTLVVSTANEYCKVIADKFSEDTADHRILSLVYNLSEKNKGIKKITLVSKDVNLRMKAKSLHLYAEDYETDKAPQIDEQYRGYEIIEDIDSEIIDDLFENESVKINFENKMIYNNQYFVFKSKNNQSALVRYDGKKDEFIKIKDQGAYGIQPRNVEQRFAIDALLDDSIKLVTLQGSAGTGKTLCSLAAAIEARSKYKQILLARPVVVLQNQDIGFLPGDMEEKLSPFMQPLWDNLDVIKDQYKPTDQKFSTITNMVETNKIKVMALAYIRGRSLPRNFFIIDECFPYDELVLTEKGRRKIGGLVVDFMRNKKVPKVLSLNENTGVFEYKKIVNANYMGERELVEVKIGLQTIRCTPNHKFLTMNGWLEAKDLKPGMKSVSNIKNHHTFNELTPDLEQVIIGSFLGDGHISKISDNSYRVSIIHGESQKEYCEFKADLFKSKIKRVDKNGYKQSPAYRFNSKKFHSTLNFPATKTTCPKSIVDKINILALAIWFQDDGSVYPQHNGATISTCSFDLKSNELLIAKLKEFGIECSIFKSKDFYSLRMDKENYLKLSKLIAPYVHKNLEYKIHPDHKDIEKININNNNSEIYYQDVKGVNYLNKNEKVFDIAVEDNHNFVIVGPSNSKNKCGVVVHNCQNTTPHELKTIITRAGEGTKIILCGDVSQIDSPYLDAQSNGLSYVIEKFKGQECYAHITLAKGERSALAELASKIL